MVLPTPDRWSLGILRWDISHYPDITANTTVEEPVEILDLKLEAEAGETKTKREAIEEEEEEEKEKKRRGIEEKRNREKKPSVPKPGNP